MSILPVKIYPDPVLRKKASEVKGISPEIKKLAEDMKETMLKKDGVGLAANQVGELKRIIAVQTEGEPAVFINPKIIKRSKETEKMEEGCLSLPGIWLEVKRARDVEMEALDLEGKRINIKAAGFTARVFQHEIDHLNGVLIIDKMSFLQKLKYKIKKHGFD